MDTKRYWSVEQCGWVESPPVAVVVPGQREEEPVQEAVDA